MECAHTRQAHTNCPANVVRSLINPEKKAFAPKRPHHTAMNDFLKMFQSEKKKLLLLELKTLKKN
jgi:hypothetical protein